METIVPIENRARLEPSDLARFDALLVQHSVKHALEWLLKHAPPLAPTEMVTQDEYSHDILVAYPGSLWLVYDST